MMSSSTTSSPSLKTPSELSQSREKSLVARDKVELSERSLTIDYTDDEDLADELKEVKLADIVTASDLEESSLEQDLPNDEADEESTTCRSPTSLTGALATSAKFGNDYSRSVTSGSALVVELSEVADDHPED